MANFVEYFHCEFFPNCNADIFGDDFRFIGLPFQIEHDGIRLWFELCLTANDSLQGEPKLDVFLRFHRGPLRSVTIWELELGFLAPDATRVYTTAKATGDKNLEADGDYVGVTESSPGTIDTLKKNGVLGDNETLNVFCKFKLQTDQFSQIKPNRYASPLGIMHNLAKLKDGGCCFDFELRSSLDGGTIPCHKFVLATASPGLEAFVLANEGKGFAKLDVYERAIRELVHGVYSEHHLLLNTFAFDQDPKFSTMRQMFFLATNFELPAMLAELEELLRERLVQIRRRRQPSLLERQALVVLKLVKKYSLKKVEEFVETLNNNKQCFDRNLRIKHMFLSKYH